MSPTLAVVTPGLPAMRSVLLALIAALHVPAARAQSALPEGTRTDTGSVGGAAYVLHVPPGWHGGLVLYAHGYALASGLGQTAPEALAAPFLRRGFAFAASDYRTVGYAVREAIEDTEALRAHFAGRYGAPDSTFIMGHSMGGLVAVASVERHPGVYAGALSLCGLLVPPTELMRRHLFGLLVVSEALFPGSTPTLDALASGAAPPAGHDAVRAALAADPAGAERMARRFGVTWGVRDSAVAVVAGVVGFAQHVYRELAGRTGGNPYDNRNAVYAGFGDDAALNRSVRRYAADAASASYVRDHYTPTGRVDAPVLAVHTLRDELIPVGYVAWYDEAAASAGAADRYVHVAVDGTGHCAIPLERIEVAFDRLRAWAGGGERPRAGMLD